MPVRQRDNKWYWGSKGPFDSRKKAEKVAQAAHASGHVSKSVAELTEFMEKAPFGIKNPFASKPDAVDLSPDEAEAEAVPEGNRKYLKEGEKPPENVPELKGKRQGRFYDMSQLGEEHGDEITDVFNDLIGELRELETDEGTKKQREEEKKLLATAAEATDALDETLPSYEEAKAAEGYLFYLIKKHKEDNPDDTSGDALFDTPDFQKALDKHEVSGGKLVDERTAAMISKKPSQEAKVANDAQDDWDDSRKPKKVSDLHEKIGNALIHSFKVNGFQVDDIKLKVDPDMKYATWGPKYDNQVAGQLKEILEEAGKLPQDQIDALVRDVTHGREDALPPAVKAFVEGMADSLHGQYNAASKEFVMSPSMFKKLTKMAGEDLSPEEKTGMLSAFGTMVHESLHSEEGYRAAVVMTKYNEGRTHDNPALLQDHLNKLFEEAPVELLSKAIVGRKYNSDFVGKNVYEDRGTFIDGAGGQEQHTWDGYPEMLPHVAKWALGLSKGDPVKARALLGEMRDLRRATKVFAEKDDNKRQAQVVKHHQRMNELSLSFGTYMESYAKKHNLDSDSYGGQASIVAEGLDNKYGKVRLTPDLMVREEGRTHNDDGSITDDAHLDLMHLVYGTKASG